MTAVLLLDSDELAAAFVSLGAAVDVLRWGDPVSEHASVIPWGAPEPTAAYRDWLALHAPVAAWLLDRRNLYSLALPFPPTRHVEPGTDLAGPGFARGLFVGQGSGPVGAELKHACLLQPLLPSALEEGEVEVQLVRGVLLKAERLIPTRHGTIRQPLGLIHGEVDLAMRAVSVLQQRFDALLDRRAPPFAVVGLLRHQGELVITRLSLHGPSGADAASLERIATAYLNR